MTKLACTALGLVLTTAAVAQTPTTTLPATPAPAVTTGAAQTMATIPSNSMTVTEWYKQNVYDPQDNKIGEIMDVLMDREGKATALIIGVGGFLGAGERMLRFPSRRSNSSRRTTSPIWS